ncbi:hypothetical protein MRX96_019466 [Rhipicephalus microplus]
MFRLSIPWIGIEARYTREQVYKPQWKGNRASKRERGDVRVSDHGSPWRPRVRHNWSYARATLWPAGQARPVCACAFGACVASAAAPSSPRRVISFLCVAVSAWWLFGPDAFENAFRQGRLRPRCERARGRLLAVRALNLRDARRLIFSRARRLWSPGAKSHEGFPFVFPLLHLRCAFVVGANER